MRGVHPRKKKNTPLILAAAICVLSLIVMVVALTGQKQPQATGEFTPPPFDSAAVVGTPDVPDGLGYSELDCKVYKVSLCGKPNADGDIYLTNPETNGVWLKVRVLDAGGNILGETGLVRPGEYVRTVVLNETPKAGTPITLKIMAYEPDTYYSAGAASLNTTIH